jgi:hypothetical protein
MKRGVKRSTYKITLTYNDMFVIYNLLCNEHTYLYEQDKNHPEISDIELALWSIEDAKGPHGRTFGEFLKMVEKEREQLE